MSDADAAPFRLFGALALLGGAARIATTFLVDWSQPTRMTEVIALAIDFCLLFGLAGFYFANAARLGFIGLVGFLVAASGIALIFGPDGVAFGLDIYETGVGFIAIGLVVLSVAQGLAGVARPAAALWTLSAAAGVGGAFVDRAAEGFAVAGVLFGLGFMAVGVTALRR